PCSEYKLQATLDLARSRHRTGDDAPVRCDHGIPGGIHAAEGRQAARHIEIRMVGKIEDLRPEPELTLFINGEGLVDGEVEVHNSGSDQGVASEVAALVHRL